MKSVAELWREAEEVRLVLPQILDLSNEAHASGLHKLKSNYKKIILGDLDYALDKKIEQDLWNICFKIPVTKLQSDPKDTKSRKNENSPILGWFLESASGFYLILLQEICARFQLEVPFFKQNISLGILEKEQSFKEPKKASCLYITQYCLIHLGDLSRYRNRPDEAVGYYKEAIYIEPSSGHPYNQLALLEAAGGDKLLTMYYYCRSLTLQHPFPPAKKNLEILHKKNTSFNITYKSSNRLSAEEFLVSFFKFQGQIELCCDLDQAEQIGRLLALTIAPLIATDSLTVPQVLRMLQINMYYVDTKNSKKLECLSNDEKRCLHWAIELTASILNACLVSAYSLSGEQLISYSFLPVVKLVLDWLFANPNLLFHSAVYKRHSLWSAAAKLFNGLQLAIGQVTSTESQDDSPLPEDSEFAQFSPLRQLADSYRLVRQAGNENGASSEKINPLRALRILERAKWLSQQELNGAHCLTATAKGESSDSSFPFVFESPNIEDSQLTQLGNQLEALSTETSPAGNPKKGILKDVKILTRKPRNVALAAIMKQNTEESAPSPVSTGSGAADPDQSDSSKQVKFQMPDEKIPPPAVALLPTPPLLPLPPPPLLPNPPINMSNAYPRAALPPRLERLRAEQKDRDILNHLGLYSGFGTSLTSTVSSAIPSDAHPQMNSWPNVSVPPPPPPVPPPGLGFRPPRDSNVPPPWPNFSSLPQTGAGPGSGGYSLFNSQTWSPGQVPVGFPTSTTETRNSFEHLPYNRRPPFPAPTAAPPAGSLWSGPGPSPLERLLEQQKALRGSSPAKTFTNPHHHKMNSGL